MIVKNIKGVKRIIDVEIREKPQVEWNKMKNNIKDYLL